jgi:hypothetical protein
MGFEYRAILPKAAKRSDLITLLRGAPHFKSCDEQERYFRYDAVPTRKETEMPDAHLEIESDSSIYLCDNGGKGEEVVSYVEENLRARFGDIKIEEL